MSGQRNTTWLQTREVTPDPHRCRDWIKFVSYFINKGRQLQAARSQIVSQYVVRCTKTRQWWHLLAICQNCSSSSQGWYFSRKSHRTDPQCVAKRFLIFIMSKRTHTHVYTFRRTTTWRAAAGELRQEDGCKSFIYSKEVLSWLQIHSCDFPPKSVAKLCTLAHTTFASKMTQIKTNKQTNKKITGESNIINFTLRG